MRQENLGAHVGKTGPDDAYIDEPEKINVARYWVGEVGFELMESTAPDGDVAKFIERNGEGVMLISFNVDNTRKAVDELKAKDYPFIPDSKGEIARPFRDCEFAFVHPKKLNGVLTELIDYKWMSLRGNIRHLKFIWCMWIRKSAMAARNV